MELKLNIYKNGEVEKTYQSDTYDILFGTVDDMLDLIDIDKLDKKDNEIEIARIIVQVVPKLKGLLKEVFPGITEEEIKRTKIKELVPVFMNIVKFSISGINSTNEGKQTRHK